MKLEERVATRKQPYHNLIVMLETNLHDWLMSAEATEN